MLNKQKVEVHLHLWYEDVSIYLLKKLKKHWDGRINISLLHDAESNKNILNFASDNFQEVNTVYVPNRGTDQNGFFASYKIIGTQSAVTTPSAIPLILVTIASALILDLKLFLLISTTLLLCVWCIKISLFFFTPIFFDTKTKFLWISFFLSFEPLPQFKLLYIPFENPPLFEKKQCFIFLIFLRFFE